MQFNNVNADHINSTDFEQLEQKLILTTNSKHVLSINNKIWSLMLEDGRHTIVQIQLGLTKKILQRDYSFEFLHKQTPYAMLTYNFTHKRESIIVLPRNMNLVKGMCNGTRPNYALFQQPFY